MDNPTCKQRVAYPAAQNSAQLYLLTIAPVGADLVLICLYLVWRNFQ
jgi:hypothetical protein